MSNRLVRREFKLLQIQALPTRAKPVVLAQNDFEPVEDRGSTSRVRLHAQEVDDPASGMKAMLWVRSHSQNCAGRAGDRPEQISAHTELATWLDTAKGCPGRVLMHRAAESCLEGPEVDLRGFKCTERQGSVRMC